MKGNLGDPCDYPKCGKNRLYDFYYLMVTLHLLFLTLGILLAFLFSIFCLHPQLFCPMSPMIFTFIDGTVLIPL